MREREVGACPRCTGGERADKDGAAGGVVPVDFPSAAAARLGSVGGTCSWGARRGVQGQAGDLTSSAASPPWICSVEISRRLGGGGDLERRVGQRH